MVAIVRNPRTGELLTTNWESSRGSKLFVYGQPADGESSLDAALRHIKADTGYDNVRLVDVVNNVTFHYTSHDDQENRAMECQ